MLAGFRGSTLIVEGKFFYIRGRGSVLHRSWLQRDVWHSHGWSGAGEHRNASRTDHLIRAFTREIFSSHCVTGVVGVKPVALDLDKNRLSAVEPRVTRERSR